MIRNPPAKKGNEIATSVGPEVLQAHAHREAGRHEQAQQLCQQALAKAPHDADALFLAGVMADERGDHRQATTLLERALQERPEDALILDNLGLAYGSLGHDDRAIATFRRAIQAQPDLAESHNNLGTLLRKHGQLDQAFDHFKKALAAKPDFVVSMNNLAVMLHDAKENDQALNLLNRAMALDANHPDTFCNLGVVLLAKREIDIALRVLQRAVQLDPNSSQAHYNIGRAHQERRAYPQAVEAYRRSIAIFPGQAEALNNLGATLDGLDRFEEAEEAFDAAIKLAPDHAHSHWNRGLLLLRCGQWREGWREYEWRWKTADFPSPKRDFSEPLWDGQAKQGASILLHAEQGLGDSMQFIRFASLVKKLVGRVLFLCPPKLARLLATAPGIDQLVLDDGSKPPPFDMHVPLMSLPHLLGVEEQSLPLTDGYLTSEEKLTADWAGRVRGPEKMTVGLCWQGNKGYKGDGERSIPLSAFAPLLELPEVRFISLQTGDATAQITQNGLDERIHGYADLDAGSDAFIDSAAIISKLDLVITSDTSIPHLAGALGTPVWILLAQHPDWRWMVDRPDTPWYKKARLFRQTVAGDWPRLMNTVAAALRRSTANGNVEFTE